jgi:2-phosphosulfolactate phosphatase
VNVAVYYIPAELATAELPDQVVVIDVLRATSTVVEALSNGAKAVFPVATAEGAARIAAGIGRDSVLLCGERRGLPIDGFDLGNAPPEFDRDRVEGASLVMTTTNGTQAFLAVAEARGGADGPGAILAGAFLNLAAISEVVAGGGRDTAIVCAGREGRYALEDALCAGALVQELERSGAALELNDGARAARSMAVALDGGWMGAIRETAAARRLMEIGRAEDVEFCTRLNRTSVVPRFRDRTLTAE